MEITLDSLEKLPLLSQPNLPSPQNVVKILEQRAQRKIKVDKQTIRADSPVDMFVMDLRFRYFNASNETAHSNTIDLPPSQMSTAYPPRYNSTLTTLGNTIFILDNTPPREKFVNRHGTREEALSHISTALPP